MRVYPYAIERIMEHCKAEAPREACGLLACKDERYADSNRSIDMAIVEIFPVKNIHENPREGFFMDPEQQLRALRKIRREGFTYCGIYHSHPRDSAVPSDADMLSPDPDYNFIVSLRNGAEIIRAYKPDRDGLLQPQDINGRRIMQVGRPAQGFVPNPVDPDVLWRAYIFDDNAEEKLVTYDNRDTLPEDVPDRCVCMLQQLYTNKVEMIFWDFIVLDHEGRWKGASQADIDTEIALGTPYSAVTAGYYANTLRFHRMVSIILRDSSFPQPDVRVDGLIEDGVI